MTCFHLLYAFLLPLSTCPDKISQQSHQSAMCTINRHLLVLFTTIDTSQFPLHRVCHKEREALWRGPRWCFKRTRCGGNRRVLMVGNNTPTGGWMILSKCIIAPMR